MALQYAARKAIFGRKEAASGTAEALVAADAVITNGVQVVPANIRGEDRSFDRNYFGAFEHITIGATTDVTFSVYLGGKGGGTAGDPRYARFIESCGFVKSAGVWKPISDSIPSMTIRGEYQNVVHTAVGCRGTLNVALNSGALPTMNFSFMGLYADATKAKNAASYGDQAKPHGVNKDNTRVTFTPSGGAAHSPVMQSLAFDLSAANEYINDPNREEILFTDRKASGSLSVELDDSLTPNYTALAKAGAEGVLAIEHYPAGAAAGQKVSFNFPRVQLTNPTYGSAQGRHTVQMQLKILPDTGNDEIEITFA